MSWDRRLSSRGTGWWLCSEAWCSSARQRAPAALGLAGAVASASGSALPLGEWASQKQRARMPTNGWERTSPAPLGFLQDLASHMYSRRMRNPTNRCRNLPLRWSSSGCVSTPPGQRWSAPSGRSGREWRRKWTPSKPSTWPSTRCEETSCRDDIVYCYIFKLNNCLFFKFIGLLLDTGVSLWLETFA